MKTAIVKTATGETWSTSINGTNEEIRAYFVGQWFNIGNADRDRMVQVVSVEITP